MRCKDISRCCRAPRANAHYRTYVILYGVSSVRHAFLFFLFNSSEYLHRNNDEKEFNEPLFCCANGIRINASRSRTHTNLMGERESARRAEIDIHRTQAHKANDVCFAHARLYVSLFARSVSPDHNRLCVSVYPFTCTFDMLLVVAARTRYTVTLAQAQWQQMRFSVEYKLWLRVDVRTQFSIKYSLLSEPILRFILSFWFIPFKYYFFVDEYKAFYSIILTTIRVLPKISFSNTQNVHLIFLFKFQIGRVC